MEYTYEQLTQFDERIGKVHEEIDKLDKSRLQKEQQAEAAAQKAE